MNYRTDLQSGNQVSVLGYGCMRFPRGIRTQIDSKKTEKLILSAIERGVNYFDTAYVYGGSEQVLGQIFKRNEGIREKIYLATKLPFIHCQSYEDFDRIFNKQLERLNTDYIDYYLIHNITDTASWDRIRKLGIEKWIAGKKESGQIRHIGFSFHGIQNEFLGLLEEYDWDFCQIQYNYMNENYQAGRKGLQKAHEKGLMVVIMEPLLGGKLAVGLPKKAAKLFEETNHAITPAAWALRWLWNQKEVTVILSGMNSEEQLDDNIKTAETAEIGILTGKENETIKKAVSVFKESYKIPCTGCNYCLPCPNGVNIPGSFAAYNVSYASGFVTGMMQYMTSIGALNPGKNQSGKNCTVCGKCEKQCPQNIKITKSLKKVTRRLEPVGLHTALKVYRKISK